MLERKVVKGKERKEKKEDKGKEKDKDIFFKEKNNKKENMPQTMSEIMSETVPETVPEAVQGEAVSEEQVSLEHVPSEQVLESKVVCSRQGEVFEYFNSVYKKSIGIKYAYKATDFINLARKIKEFGEDITKQKIDKFYVLCTSSQPPQWWYKGGISDFTIENLIRHWNKIVDIESNTEREKRHLEELADKKLKERGLMV